MRRRPLRYTLLRNAAFNAAFFVASISLAVAEPVTVTAEDGSLAFEGEVLGFDGRYLRLATQSGEITLDYEGAICAGSACPDPETFVPQLQISGISPLVDRLLPPLIAAYARDRGWQVRVDGMRQELWPPEARRPAATIVLMGRADDRAIADLIDGTADLALTSQPLDAPTRSAALQAGLGDLSRDGLTRIIALDAVVGVASPLTEMQDVRLEALIDIIEGRRRDWTDLAAGTGELRAIVPHQPFLPLPGTPYAVEHLPESEIADAVLGDATALGIVGYGAWGNTLPLALSGPCGRPIPPDLRSVKTGDYPLTRPIFLYRPARRLPEPSQDFLVWLRSREAQGVIRRAGFVDLAADRIAIDQQGERLAAAISAAGPEIGLGELQRLVRILAGHDRLTPTFRFADGSTRLSPQSRSYLLQLARAIREGQYDGDVLMLVGFSDGRGPAMVNRELSRARAEAVRRALLLTLGGSLPDEVTVATEAFGEALPIACDDVAWGQNVNRRVELWIARQGAAVR